MRGDARSSVETANISDAYHAHWMCRKEVRRIGLAAENIAM
jgi:hypothetical protein